MIDRVALTSTLAGAVADLCEPRTHYEPYFLPAPDATAAKGRTAKAKRRRKSRARQRWAWPTDQPSLLDQLRALADERGVGQAAAGGAYRSGPPGDLEALDRLMAIEAASAYWVSHRLGLILREPCEANLRALVGAGTAADDDLLAELAREVDRWRAWAEVLTGWRSPLFRPHAPCPCCERTGSLRVNLDRATGLCMACGETWDRATLDDLADHIRDHGRAQPAGA